MKMTLIGILRDSIGPLSGTDGSYSDPREVGSINGLLGNFKAVNSSHFWFLTLILYRASQRDWWELES